MKKIIYLILISLPISLSAELKTYSEVIPLPTQMDTFMRDISESCGLKT